MPSNRLSHGWALKFALGYFNWDESRASKVIGNPGWHHMMGLWKIHGDGFYHLPDFVMRQEWFHSTEFPKRDCPGFYEDIPDGGTLLDFGCGTAEQERAVYLEKGGRAILMDIPGANFEYLRSKYRSFKEVQTAPIVRGVQLPRRYDALLCMDVLEHVPDPIEVLEQIWEGLKPGGQALIWFDPSYPAPGHLMESIAQIPIYERWLLKNTTIIKQSNIIDWVEKPRRWWKIWT